MQQLLQENVTDKLAESEEATRYLIHGLIVVVIITGFISIYFICDRARMQQLLQENLTMVCHLQGERLKAEEAMNQKLASSAENRMAELSQPFLHTEQPPVVHQVPPAAA